VPYTPGPALRDALKTYEYLACGKPVVLTADSVVPELAPFVRKAPDAPSFARACRELAACPAPAAGAMAVLRELTWDRRAARALSLCRTLMTERKT
jgi:glycosyltransferase involved in cell wall biosynthesis